MLVALALLAERAAGRCLPVRWLVLCLLRRAEIAVFAFVAEETGWEWPFPGEPGEAGNGPADALFLGARLRALAALLDAMLAWAAGFTGHALALEGGPGRPASLPGRFVLVFARAGRTGMPYDTS